MSLRSAADPQYARPLTRLIDRAAGPLNLAGYEAEGGYASLRKAVSEMQPMDVQNVVKASNLRGRGGAGFPTGVKWNLVPMGPDAGAKYLVCNSDEMEPGTFKDRLLMEQAPHQLIEAVMIAGYAIQATGAYIFLRGEYVVAEQRLRRAIDEARAKGYVGKDVFGSPFSLDVVVHTGAGRYICGEETALMNSLEGRRATPRAKPPFPQIAGVWGRP
ncbi:MAG TPA: NADH-quinone oxidoreductase subunit F, partial [Pseudomonadales bacterium]|nr:NADH-quinone oxidoreductase subunit F [Pseudomonadales bacterium]